MNLLYKILYYSAPYFPFLSIKRYLFKKNLRPDDIFFVGHPKSGNTWLALALALLKTDLERNSIHISNLKKYIPTIHGNDAGIVFYQHLPSPRIFRNEWPEYPDAYPKTIYIVRDPRSALVSYYHHYSVLYPEKRKTIDEFVHEYVTYGHIPDFEPALAEWNIQVQEWLNRKGHQPVYVITYENLKQDFRSSLSAIASFAGIPYTKSHFEEVIRKTTFEAMRKDEQEFGSESYPKTASGKLFVRQGNIGGWKNELSAESIRVIEKKYGHLMRQFGYELTT